MGKLNRVATVQALPEQVRDVLCAEDFIPTVDKAREEVIDCTYSQIEKTDEATVFEIEITSYKHKKTGALDKSGTETNHAEYRWEEKKQTLSYVFKGSGRIDVSGVYCLEPVGQTTRIQYDAQVKVNIPLVGKVIEKLILKEMDRSFSATLISELKRRM
jgi:carbon monoxide dehydrogenase subunit G